MTDHVLTGTTGFVGSHLLSDLLSDDTTGSVYALARGTAERSAAERVHAALAVAGHRSADGQRPLTVVESELTEPLCGVAAAAVPRGDGPLVFWHIAASLQWQQEKRASVFETNVEGTRHALELAKSLGADLFVYVSTAYTCGTLHGDLPEALHRPPAFNNAYEESKCAAEHLVAGSEGLRTLILRPSVVMGTSHDHRPSGSYTGLYGYLTTLRRFQSELDGSGGPVRFAADRDTTISFIPVDHLVEDFRAIVGAEMAAPRRSVYHVSGRTESTVGELTDYMLKILGMDGQILLVDETLEDLSPLELSLAKRLEFFSGYLRAEKRFIRSQEPERSTPFHELTRFIDAEVTLASG
ncbi:SDR family oxidoreductase [Streptomyces sp. NPDC002067]